ncbi:MAG: hypothetical protein ACK48N_07635, partial [Planctomyces sp.]
HRADRADEAARGAFDDDPARRLLMSKCCPAGWREPAEPRSCPPAAGRARPIAAPAREGPRSTARARPPAM